MRSKFAKIHIRANHSDIISTDVFDTLLLRRGISERTRITTGEARFSRLLATNGIIRHRDDLIHARLLAQRLAYRALNMMAPNGGEVRLVDVISRQLAILNLPQAMIDDRLAIEISIEKTALLANGPLAMLLRRSKMHGARVVAISDTGLSEIMLSELINHFHGPGLIDKVYSSADIGMTKRGGNLFAHVMHEEAVSAENMLHLGDDAKADFLVPNSMGIPAVHFPISKLQRWASLVNGGKTEMFRQISQSRRLFKTEPGPSDKKSFGRQVFGPIAAEFCLSIWLYIEEASKNGDAALLFCARGGIGIRETFERFLVARKLQTDAPRANLLVSRLVAARAAIVVRSPAVLDELGREFSGLPFIEVANALGGKTYDLGLEWNSTFDPNHFFEMLETQPGRQVLSDIIKQNELFERHLNFVSGGARRIILCDTGLYGSTQRLLAAGFPDRHFETIQFARCNYKGLSEDHFSRTVGLIVEQRFYTRTNVKTAILRYWQIAESLFEPAVPSVRILSEDAAGDVVANSGNIKFGCVDPTIGNLLLEGALEYIDQAPSGSEFFRDSRRAWYRLRKAIINPTPTDLAILSVGVRSVDFGRSQLVEVINKNSAGDIVQQLKAVKNNMWREGGIAKDFRRLRIPLIVLIELSHVFRGISWHFRSSGRN
ncbi:hydrolase [Rhizobium tumorigenes]|uniref:hydrolase n=1 Tax=Rhizobium tumorigenes TaxID=2041385 RepID=UPI00241DF22B|nr:hydrolase [Rhizobium tumorigenes]WFS03313.1 hydrolase [Rhizobium tumorigenes]